jgi:hypothetical protein
MKRAVCLCLSTALILGILACAGPLFKNYGLINPSSEATLSVENHSIVKEFRYYISGADANPNALMGLHRDDRLDPATLWREVEMTPRRMKEIVEGIQTKASQYGQSAFGFDLLDDRGVKIGIWYSILTARTFLRRQEDGTIRIDTPELETYIKLEPFEDQ